MIVISLNTHLFILIIILKILQREYLKKKNNNAEFKRPSVKFDQIKKFFISQKIDFLEKSLF